MSASNLNSIIQYEIQKAQKIPKKETKLITLVHQLKMVQRRAARWVTGRYHTTYSVSDMLRSLDWRSLVQRRVDSRLTTLYKIRNHLVAIDKDRYMQRGTGRRERQYRQLRATPLFLLSFRPRTVKQWNQFPSQICLAEPLDIFKTQVAQIEHSRLSFNLKHFFYLFVFLPLYFLLPFQSSYLSNSSFSFLLLIFPFLHSIGDTPQS